MKHLSFKEIAIQYKAIFFDAYGVLKKQNGLMAGIKSTLNFLAEMNIPCYILTNDASKSPAALAQFYQNEGITSITEHTLISSGNLAGDYLKKQFPQGGNVVYVGNEEAAYYLQNVGFNAIPLSQYQMDAPCSMVAFAVLDDKGVDLSFALNKAINLIRNNDVPLVLANPDLIYPSAEKEVSIAAGGIASCLELITGKKFIRFGKPDSGIFQYTFDRLNRENQVQKHEILMVGDTLETDIAGGANFGCDTALVLSGNTQPGNAQELIQESGIFPDFIGDSALIASPAFKV